MHFFTFSLFSWVNFSHLDPDPHSQCGSWSRRPDSWHIHADLDPQHCWKMLIPTSPGQPRNRAQLTPSTISCRVSHKMADFRINPLKKSWAYVLNRNIDPNSFLVMQNCRPLQRNLDQGSADLCGQRERKKKCHLLTFRYPHFPFSYLGQLWKR